MCDDDVQNSLVHTTGNFVSLSEKEALTLLEGVVIQKSNPAVHYIVKGERESIKSYSVRLTSSAIERQFIKLISWQNPTS